MLTQEDLKAISLLIKNEVEPIQKNISELKSDVAVMKEDISSLKSDVVVVKEDISSLKSDVSDIKEDIEEIKENCEITRTVTNDIGEWVDFYFHDDKPYPLDEDEMERYRERMKS